MKKIQQIKSKVTILLLVRALLLNHRHLANYQIWTWHLTFFSLMFYQSSSLITKCFHYIKQDNLLQIITRCFRSNKSEKDFLPSAQSLNSGTNARCATRPWHASTSVITWSGISWTISNKLFWQRCRMTGSRTSAWTATTSSTNLKILQGTFLASPFLVAIFLLSELNSLLVF